MKILSNNITEYNVFDTLKRNNNLSLCKIPHHCSNSKSKEVFCLTESETDCKLWPRCFMGQKPYSSYEFSKYGGETPRFLPSRHFRCGKCLSRDLALMKSSK